MVDSWYDQGARIGSSAAPAAVPAPAPAAPPAPAPAPAPEPAPPTMQATPSITVLGGSGFVGSRVCKLLVEEGVAVTSVSPSGKAPDWCKGESWAASVEWKANEFYRGAREGLEEAVGSPSVVVSCLGAVGFDGQYLLQGNGKANVEAVKAANKTGTLQKIVYVSVASEVAAAEGWLPPFFLGYFAGKRKAEAAMVAAVGEEATCIVKPSFIYGGDSFGLFPPRVTAGYGAAIEQILSNGLITKLADVLPGLIKVALRPPVSVDAVAAACAGAALGTVPTKVYDGTAEINGATGRPTATGLTDFLDGLKGEE